VPQDNHADNDSSEANKKDNRTSRATVRANAFGLWWVIIGGCIATVALLFISIYLPNLAERVKFFTANFLSLLVLVIIAVQTYIYRRQSDAMDIQAETMQRQLDVMNEQGRIMRDSLAETQQMISQNERAVVASEKQATMAEENAAAAKEAFYIAERPYVSIQGVKSVRLVAGGNSEISIWLFNGGRTPAWNITNRTTIIFDYELVEVFQWDTPLAADENAFMLPAGQKQMLNLKIKDFITQERIDAIQSGELKLMLIGDVCYKDFGGKEQVYSYRGLYEPDSNTIIHY
jgi:hypothetical protein